MLKRLLNQCTVRLHLETLEPLLVKSGSAVVHGPDMAFVRTNRNGHFEPFLPGSSLKGVLRSHAERIARTLQDKSVCDVFRGARVDGCSSRFKGHDVNRSHPSDYRYSCPACRLFGSLHWKGRFSIGDAYLTPDYRNVEPEVRDGIGIDRISGGVAGGAKFDLEVMPAGVVFETQLDVLNFELWQLGWIAYVLRDLAEGYLRVGLGTARGLGRVQGHLDELVLSYIGEPPILQERIAGIGALVSADDRKAYGLVEADYVPRPDAVSFERPPGSLRTQVRLGDQKTILDLLAAVAPAWDAFIRNQPALSNA